MVKNSRSRSERLAVEVIGHVREWTPEAVTVGAKAEVGAGQPSPRTDPPSPLASDTRSLWADSIDIHHHYN